MFSGIASRLGKLSCTNQAYVSWGEISSSCSHGNCANLFSPETNAHVDGYCLQRNYDDAKLQENLDAEIFGVLSEEAKEGFDEGVVVELNSESADDIDSNCERIVSWVEAWKKQHA